MAKRKPLSFDSQELSGNLKKSTAKGIDAFFTASSQSAPLDNGKDATEEKTSGKQNSESPPPKKATRKKKGSANEPKQPRHHDTTTPFNHDTMISRYHDTIIQEVRRAVKEVGKEAATHRFTQDEKKAIAAIIYAYLGQGIRTSENEIARIAINFLVEDYRENGENSVLHKVLRALND